MRTGFWWGNLKERDHFKNVGKDGGHNIKIVSLRNRMGTWAGFIWLRSGTGGGPCGHRNATSVS